MKRRILSQHNVEVGEDCVFECFMANVSNRIATRVANKIGLELFCSIGVQGLDFQIKVFERLIALCMLQFVMPNYVVQCKEFLQCEVVYNSLAITWKGLKYGVGKD